MMIATESRSSQNNNLLLCSWLRIAKRRLDRLQRMRAVRIAPHCAKVPILQRRTEKIVACIYADNVDVDVEVLTVYGLHS